MFAVDFEPVRRHAKCSKDKSILDCARELNIGLVSICGGVGTCKHCRVKIVSGEVSELTPEEQSAFSDREINQHCRLACLCYPRSDLKIYIPSDSLTAPQRTQVEGLELEVEPEPFIRSFDVQLTPPSLGVPEPDDQNLWSALARQYDVAEGMIDLKVQQQLSPFLRSANWQVRVAMRDDEIIALGPSSTRWLGLAVDIGTTKIAVYLVDIESGKTLASKGLMNPQISYGEDVVSRIVAAGKSHKNAAKLQSLIVDALNMTAASLCESVHADPSHIADAVFVGNTAIHHLFLQLPVQQLGVSPYVPAVRLAVDVKTRDIGLHFAPGAYAHLMPNVAGYVGADHVAMLLAIGIAEAGPTVLAVDIGTNTEICLNHKGRITSVSCASGPAFEGAHIKHGMRAAPGAIEHVRLLGEKLDIQTIGGEPPVGICGSGLLDIVAQLRLNGVLDKSGRMHPHPLVRNLDGMVEFVLAERTNNGDVTVSQKDVRELQLAKTAIRLGIRALVEAEGLTEESIDQVILAGAFGTYIDVESAIEIGMLPDLPLDRFKQVGNAAGTGARLALISRSQRARAQQIALRDGYIELGTIPDFNLKFAQASAMSRSIV
ncbi:MAG: DUF4445 domain-containing protein [Acidobacteria bacterium]|nr:DUF4445 domain-containing protein [Acidobacteriota bacterium]